VRVVNRYRSLCVACSRLRFDAEKAWCAAFPRGIPDEIGFGMFDHRKPFPRDRGIRFELRLGYEEDLRYFECSFEMFQEDREQEPLDRRARFRVIRGGRSD
jgi:hypothetical protein